MPCTEQTGANRVALYVRDDLPSPARRRAEQVSDRLASLAAVDSIAAYDVYQWTKRIKVCDTDEQVSRDLFDAFANWAGTEGVRLTPFFETRECYSTDTGERCEWLVFPAMCLVVYEDDELACVYPHADESTCYSVEEGLDRLESDHANRESNDERLPAGTAD